MQCAQARLAISARLDGEDPSPPDHAPGRVGPDPGAVDGHLAACADCRAWQAEADAVTRAVRLSAAEPPDLAERVLAAVGADRRVQVARARRQARSRRTGGAAREAPRWALAISAGVQLVLAAPALFTEPAGLDAHVGREMASFDVAIAVGFLLAAARPAYARALLPVAAALTACLLLTSVVDIAGGRAAWTHELAHLLAAVQAGLLWLVSRGRPPAQVGAARVSA